MTATGGTRVWTDTLERRLRDCAPEYSLQGDHRDRLRARLERKLRGRAPLHRVVAAPVLVLAAALVILLGTDQGSSDFRLEVTDKMVGDRAILESPLGNYRTSNTEPGAPLSADQRKHMEDLYESVASGQGKLVGGSGWTIKGNTMLFMNFESLVDGRVETLTEAPVAPDRDAGVEILRFLETQQQAFLDKVAAGVVPGTGTMEMVLLGHPVLFSKWTAEWPGWGEITYWEYVPRR